MCNVMCSVERAVLYTNLLLLSANVHRHCLWPHRAAAGAGPAVTSAGWSVTSGPAAALTGQHPPPSTLHPSIPGSVCGVWRQNTEHMAAAAAAVVTILSESGQGGTCVAQQQQQEG